ncbi:MAG: hypothetical protein FWE35_04920 [Streptosporangiales bacterium]|nr:hypothetical protein [Streptosporangiales bacterium]
MAVHDAIEGDWGKAAAKADGVPAHPRVEQCFDVRAYRCRVYCSSRQPGSSQALPLRVFRGAQIVRADTGITEIRDEILTPAHYPVPLVLAGIGDERGPASAAGRRS